MTLQLRFDLHLTFTIKVNLDMTFKVQRFNYHCFCLWPWPLHKSSLTSHDLNLANDFQLSLQISHITYQPFTYHSLTIPICISLGKIFSHLRSIASLFLIAMILPLNIYFSKHSLSNLMPFLGNTTFREHLTLCKNMNTSLHGEKRSVSNENKRTRF